MAGALLAVFELETVSVQVQVPLTGVVPETSFTLAIVRSGAFTSTVLVQPLFVSSLSTMTVGGSTAQRLPTPWNVDSQMSRQRWASR